MRRSLALLFGLLLLASPAWGEACTSSDSFIWNTFPDTGWTGCTADATDTFTVADGHVVTVSTADIAVTTGSVTIQSGGILRIECGNSLQFGASLTIDTGGWLDAQGCVIAEGRLLDQPDWTTNGSATVTLDADDLSGASTTTDWIVYGDDDPESLEETLNRREVQVGPGSPVGGAYRPSFNKWAWYDITTISGADVTYDLTPTPSGGGEYAGAPYSGTRGVVTNAAIAAADLLSEAVDWLGLTSSVQIDQDVPTVGTITGISAANPAVLTDASHGLVTGDTVFITAVVDNGPNGDLETAVNGVTFHITRVDANTYELDDLDTSGLTNIYSSGGTAVRSVATVDADLGSMYLAYNEETGANANNAAYCSGYHAKLLYADANGGTDTDGAGENLEANDVLYVAGDIAGCTSGTAWVTPGARRGDLVRIIRPAVLSGDNDADGVGEGYIFNEGGRLTAQWASFEDLGWIANTAPTVNLARNGNLVLAQSGPDGSAVDPTGYLHDFQIIFPVSQTTDTSVLGIISTTTPSGGDARFPTSGLMDMSGFSIRRGYLHDCQNDPATAAGCHGLYVDGAKNLTLAQMRIERMSDDGVGTAVLSGTSGEANSLTFRQFLVYENIAGSDNSQQGFEPTIENGIATGSIVESTVNPHWLTASDILVFGAYKEAVAIRAGGASLDRLIGGGSQTSAPGVIVSLGTGSSNATLSSTYATDNPNELRDSILFGFTGDTGAGGSLMDIVAHVRNGLLIGNYQASGPDEQLKFIHTATESVLDADEGIAASPGTFEGVTGAPLGPASLNYTDSLFRASTGSRIAQTWSAGLRMTMRRSIYAAGGVDADGPFRGFSNQSGSVVDLDGFLLSLVTNGSHPMDQTASGTVNFATNVCFETTRETYATAFPDATQSATLLMVDDIRPQADIDTRLRSIVGSSLVTHPCDDGRPRYLGLRSFGVSTAMLGDFVIEQNDRWSTGNLIGVVRGGVSRGKSF